MANPVGRVVFTKVQTLEALFPQLDQFCERLQNGSIPMAGFRPTLYPALPPTIAPAPGSPTMIVANIGAGPQWYYWNGSAWVTVA